MRGFANGGCKKEGKYSCKLTLTGGDSSELSGGQVSPKMVIPTTHKSGEDLIGTRNTSQGQAADEEACRNQQKIKSSEYIKLSPETQVKLVRFETTNLG